MHIVVAGSIINVRISGAPLETAPLAVAFLHGWGRTLADFDELVKALSTRLPEAAFVQVDLPGFGSSPLNRPDGLSIPEYAGLLDGLFVKLGARRLVLIGHSFGGKIVLHFAARFPERVAGLVLIAAAGASRKSLGLKLLTIARLAAQFALSGFQNSRASRRLSHLAGSLFASRDFQESSGPLRETLKKNLVHNALADARATSLPTLLIWGAEDVVTPLADGQRYRELIPNAQLEVLTSSGHFPFLAQPKACADLIAAFLKHA